MKTLTLYKDELAAISPKEKIRCIDAPPGERAFARPLALTPKTLDAVLDLREADIVIVDQWKSASTVYRALASNYGTTGEHAIEGALPRIVIKTDLVVHGRILVVKFVGGEPTAMTPTEAEKVRRTFENRMVEADRIEPYRPKAS